MAEQATWEFTKLVGLVGRMGDICLTPVGLGSMVSSKVSSLLSTECYSLRIERELVGGELGLKRD